MAALPLAVSPPRVLADVLPHSGARDAVLVVAGALLTVLGAQVAIHVPPSPVPITGQTLGVVLAGAALGARRGAASQLLYVLAGFALPVYADGEQGVDVLVGATGGYLVGFVVAAAIVGRMAEVRADRRVVAAFTAFCGGQLAIFGLGVPWLKVAADLTWGDAIHHGFTIFIVGGVVKALIGAAALPGAWRLVARYRDVDGVAR